MQLLTQPQLERFNKAFDIRTYIEDPSVTLEFLKGMQHVVTMVNAMSKVDFIDRDNED